MHAGNGGNPEAYGFCVAHRLAFSVIWKMDPTGVILDTWFGRTIIK